MLTETLSQGLGRYRIGDKLRALRLKKKMGLVELSSHTGLSAALLSKLERGKLFPTLPTLLRIALVFGVGLDHFFVDDKILNPVKIVRARERIRFPETPNAKDIAYEFECLDFHAVNRKSSSYYAYFQPITADRIRPHQHTGAEFIYVVTGKLGLRVAQDDYELEAGDSVYFDSSVAHGYRSVSAEHCKAVVVVIQ